MRRPIESTQYLSIRYTDRLIETGISPSVGSVGDSYDNALAESVIGLYKTELIRNRGPWRDLDHVEYATLEYIDWFNHRRLLEPIGNDLPPVSWRMLLEEKLMPEIRRRYDPEFKSGAVRIVLETGKPIAQVARDLGLHAGTLGNWLKKERLDRADYGQLDEDSLAELIRLRKEVAELRMERDVLKRSVVLWVKEATR